MMVVLWIGSFLVLLLIIVSFWRYARTDHTRMRLRWQVRTRRELEKSLRKTPWNMDAARAVLTSPGYGLSPAELGGLSIPAEDQLDWQERAMARQGWEVAALLAGLVIIGTLFAVGLAALLLAGYVYLKTLDAAWPTVLWVTLAGLASLVFILFFIRFTRRVYRTTRHMQRYH